LQRKWKSADSGYGVLLKRQVVDSCMTLKRSYKVFNFQTIGGVGSGCVLYC